MDKQEVSTRSSEVIRSAAATGQKLGSQAIRKSAEVVQTGSTRLIEALPQMPQAERSRWQKARRVGYITLALGAASGVAVQVARHFRAETGPQFTEGYTEPRFEGEGTSDLPTTDLGAAEEGQVGQRTIRDRGIAAEAPASPEHILTN